jgi:polygalacturonase
MTDTTKDAGSTRLEIPQDQRSPRVTACYTVLYLFSGIGGFSLGLESTGGFKTIAFCEINIFCRNVRLSLR